MKSNPPASKVKVSLYDSATDTHGEIRNLERIFKIIRNDEALAKQIDRIRSIKTKKQRQKAKTRLPAVTFTGTFSQRDALSLITYSGLIPLDVDDLDSTEEAEEIRDEVATSPYVYAAYVSPSGKGVKIVVRASLETPSNESYNVAIDTISDYFAEEHAVVVEKAGTVSICRLAYLSSDPDAYLYTKGPRETFVITDKDVKTYEPDQDRSSEEADAISLLTKASLVLPDVGVEEAREALAYIDPDCPRDQWVNVGLAINTQFQGSDTGLALFDEWSRGGLGDGGEPDGYDGQADVEKQWSTFKSAKTVGRPASFRSVLKMAYDEGMPSSKLGGKEKREGADALDAEFKESFLNRIEEAETITELTGTIAPALRTTDMYTETREEIAEALVSRLERLGEKVDKSDLKKLSEYDAKTAAIKAGCPSWAESLVFVTSENGGFFDTESRVFYKTHVFNEIFASKLLTPFSRANGVISPPFLASALLLNHQLVPYVEGIRYMPGADTVFTDAWDNGRYVNSYDGDAVPDKVDLDCLDEEEEAAIKGWRDHIHWLLPYADAKLLVQFLAFIVQNPDKRVRWGFLILGPEGIGKTIILEMMGRVLGGRNVASIEPVLLKKDGRFNEWAEGSQLSAFEEIRLSSRTKAETMDDLKPLISNERIRIHKKGKDSYMAKNTASYLMFTNHPDALRLSSGDRRYHVTSTKEETREGFLEALGGPEKAGDYFARIAGAAKNCAGALRSWLMKVDISEFNPDRPPAESLAKSEMIDMAKSDEERAIEDAIRGSETELIGPYMIEATALKAALEFGEIPVNLSARHFGVLLRRAGYGLVGKGALKPGGDLPAGRYYINHTKARKVVGDITGGDCYTQVIRALADEQLS